jgi:hypothetical protein
MAYIAYNVIQVHLDAMDVAGDNQLNVEHEMMKQRLSNKGLPIGVAGVEIIGEVGGGIDFACRAPCSVLCTYLCCLIVFM